jgi:Ca-activated chloride channel family protein
MNSVRTRLTQLSVLLIYILVLTGLVNSATGSSINPQEVNVAAAYNAKGLESYESGNYEDAVKSYKQAVKLKKDYSEAHYNLGDAYFQLKQYKQAIEAYKQALRYQSNLPTAYNNIGTAYYKLGEHKKAIEAFKEAIRLDPKPSLTYYNLAATYLERGNEQAALDQYKILKTADPQLAHKLYLLIHKPMAGVFGAVNGVRLNVIATDSQGSPVSDLTQEDFQVFEDSIPQIITSFSKEQFPLAYGLAIDTSGSMNPALLQAIELSKVIIQSNRPNDETLLIRFVGSDKIETVQDFTSDKNTLNDGLNTLYVEAGQSAILDAVYLTAQRVAQYKPGDTPYLRRAVILITDGDERVSYYGINDLVSLLRKIDVQIFAICLNKDSDKSSQLNKNLAKGAVGLLTTLTKETGGQAFFPKSVSELSTVIKQVTAMTHTQYLIGYKPAKAVETATYRHVNVKILDKDSRDKLSAAARAGYTVSEAEPLP